MTDYQKNVFINCPFDQDYFPLLYALLFTVIKLGFIPRIAFERSNSGEPRFNKIIQLINESKYSIHDLSRIKSQKVGEYFRLNMPFELGLDIGARLFNPSKHDGKISLILEEERYRYQAALSDLSNSDIKHHKGKAINIVKAVRNWFAENGIKKVPSPTVIWYNYNDFTSDFYEKRKSEGFSDDDLYNIPIPELIDYMIEWNKK